MPVNAFTLTGSGTTKNGKIIGYLWSLVSGPNNPDIVSPSSPTTAVSDFVVGTYHFQFMVVDSAGLTGVDTTSVMVLAAPQQTITLQPSSDASDEANIAVVGSSDATSHDKDIDAAAWTTGGAATTIRGAFKFDLSGIPASATIISAKLSLYSIPDPTNGDLVDANSGTNNAMFIRRITSAWDGNTVSWQTQPSVTASDEISVPSTTQAFLDLTDMDVKAMIDAMRVDGNYGFMLNLQNEVPFTIRQFCSNFHSDATKHPKLVIVYQ